MPRKGVTRGDLIVAIAAIGVLVFSFLPWYSVTAKGDNYPRLTEGTTDYSAWITDFWPLAPAVVLLSSISFVLLLVGRFAIRGGAQQPTEVRFGGLSFHQWGIALGAASAWSAVWAVLGADGGYEKLARTAEQIARADGGTGVTIDAGHAWGAWGLAGFAVLQALSLLVSDRISGLAAPLVKPRSNAWQGYPGGGFPGAPGGYPPGPPGTGGFAVPPPVAPPVYGPPGSTPPPRTPPMAQPPVVQPPVLYKPDTPGQGQPAVHTPEPLSEQSGQSTDPGTFEQYWLAVPEPRALQPADHAGDAIATLHPGVWYLAVGRQDDGIVIDIDGLQGVLRDLTGIQRGE
ncbi:hypothetical protein [Streptomyces sp. SID3343]|uniref:hypothetical protein n=1 Tax=Streptomyces sp. SID3343 TaxID=2690260 RepID=UPI001367ACF6|nr:hypothetical protein [Streptomyces sp. SID3343]MYV99383.1 hypothetical protein [Streptomyces sp. SID3343]